MAGSVPVALLTALCIVVSPAMAARTNVREGAPDAFDDPFGELMPPISNNPNLRAHDPNKLLQRTNEERLLASESLLSDQVELREDEQMEVLCAQHGLRTASSYDAEQANEAAVETDVRTWVPTDAEHKCLKLAMQNKFMPGHLLGLSDRYVPVPAFPESLGELVIEEVRHTDKTQVAKEKHIVLEVSGCSSCENDQTATVEWAGLLPLDEAGNPTGVKARPGDDAKAPLVEGRSSGKSSFPRQFSVASAARSQQKYVKRHTYKYSSYHFDEVVEPKVLELAETADRELVNAEFLEAHKTAAVELMKDLKEQVKHIPFNHKMEQLHMKIKSCEERDNKLSCPDQPEETLILHDGGLVVSSASALLFDELGRSTGQQCSYGACLDSRGRPRFMELNGVKYPFTMCSKCEGRQCPSTRTSPHQSLPEENWFNCMVERAYTRGGGYMDLMQQADNDLKSHVPRTEHGMLYRGTTSPGHVEGHINWHISIPPRQHCEPVLQDALYVGIGVDEADRCNELGGVDVDIGIVLISCKREEGSGTLGNTQKGSCKYYDHLNYGKKRAKSGSQAFYGISEDNRGGEGEGDDEWVFVDLAKAKQNGVSHVVFMANIFGCARGQPAGGALQWGELEGAFMRVTASGVAKKHFTAAETISYVDLDEMKGGANAGAAVYMAYLGGEDKLAVSSDVKHNHRTDFAAAESLAWKLVSLKQPIPGQYLQKSFSHVARLLYGEIIEVREERDMDEQTTLMTLADTMATGQSVRRQTDGDGIQEASWTGDLVDVIDESIAQDLSHPHPNENANMKQAREMTPEDFNQHFSEYLPEGAPGTDSYCMK